ncbi:MAG: uracil-DNA glycosylase [Crocinitomicaceae bacterium]|nr:uracil-DNA glycosylase [Crocinitomicaceae bacterium]
MEELIENNWSDILNKEFKKKYFLNLKSFIEDIYKNEPHLIYPNREKIFHAFNSCPFEKVKVVVIGQDPYPTKGYANGLCFSVNSNVYPYPKSLNNIFKELQNDLSFAMPKSGNLEKWANQGVLLLNSVLSVEPGNPGSHFNLGWEKFTDKVIQLIGNQNGIVFLLWGNKSQKKVCLINSKTNLILVAPHPSPLSAYRGFFGCSHFSKANNYLISKGKSPINWGL